MKNNQQFWFAILKKEAMKDMQAFKQFISSELGFTF